LKKQRHIGNGDAMTVIMDKTVGTGGMHGASKRDEK
jgi:hypothetical protein